MGISSLRAFVIAVALLACSATAQAAGLGKLTVLSNLGEPLRAEIDVVAVEKGEVESLVARLASPDAYVQANLPYPPSALGVRLEVTKRASGEPYLAVSSVQPINEPFIDLLVELNWAGGRMLRAYAALLDPPMFATPEPEVQVAPAPTPEEQPAPQALPEPPVETQLGSEMQPPAQPEAPAQPPTEPPATSEAPAQPTPEEAAPSATAEPAPAEGGMAPEAAQAEPAAYGPVKRGDTLSRIARQVKGEGVTLEQMLVVLFRNNPDAFMGKNMNRLKTGRVLKVPEAAEVAAVDAKQAAREFSVQAADFQVYREKLAGLAGAAPAADEAGGQAAGKITGRTEDKAAAAGDAKEVLKLSKGEAPGVGAAGGDAKTLQERIRSLEEELAARDKTLTESKDRVAKLEKTIQDMQALLEIKNKEMAQLQKPGAPVEPAPMPVPPEAAPPAPGAAPSDVTPPPAGEEKPDASPTPPAKPAIPSLPPKQEVGLFEQILAEPLYLAGGVAVLALLGLLGYRAVRNGREKAAEAPADEVRQFEPAAGKTPDAAPFAATSLATDATGSMAAAARGAPAQVSEEVDPLAEAEIYLAYGRDGQAEEILREALQINPRRHEVHLKLLEIYSKRKDLPAFDATAKQLHTVTGGQGGLWKQAAAMGYQLDPQNPLYAEGRSGAAVPMAAAGAAASAGLDETLDFNLGLDDAPAGTATDIDLGRLVGNIGGTTTDIDLTRLSEGGGDDFNLDNMPVSDATLPPGGLNLGAQAANEEPAPTSLDFNLDLGPMNGAPDVDLTQTVAGSDVTRNSVDFDINQISLEPSGARSSKTEPVLDLGRSSPAMPDLDLSSINLDLGSGEMSKSAEGGGKDERWYDVQTKFDLAKAYQEMGDKEGAREILREVMAEGDNEQKSAAEQVLAALDQ